MTVIEGNKLIALFMGATIEQDYSNIANVQDGLGFYFKKELAPDIDLRYSSVGIKYHSSWDWLMPVIAKISNGCEEPEELDGLKYALLCDDIDTAWNFVVTYLS